MSWTKRQVIERAFAKIGLRSTSFDIDPEELQSGLIELDLMMGLWERDNIRFGYPFNANPDDAKLSDSTNAPRDAVEAMVNNLAVRIAVEYGKTPSVDVTKAAKREYSRLLAQYNKPPNAARADMPSGAGNHRYGGVYNPVFIKDEELPSAIEPPAENLEFE